MVWRFLRVTRGPDSRRSSTGGRRMLCYKRSLLLALMLLSCTAVHAQWKPERTVEVVVFAAPGGGNDKSARVIHRIWQETKMVDAVVTNKVGGGGSLSYT